MSYAKNSAKLKQQLLDDKGYYECQLCGTSNSYRWEVHHIYYRSEKPKHPKLHDLANLLFCCEACHKHLHSKKSNRDRLVLERNLKEIFE